MTNPLMLQSHLVTGMGPKPRTWFPEQPSWQYALSACSHAIPQVHILWKGALVTWASGVDFDFWMKAYFNSFMDHTQRMDPLKKY